MDLTKMTVTELKALAYDLFGQSEQIQRSLTVVNQEISKKLSEEKNSKDEKKK